MFTAAHLPVTSFHPVVLGTVPPSSKCQSVHFFLDFSNIGIGAQQLAIEYGDSHFDLRHLRLHSQHLRDIALRGRKWGSGFAAAGLGANGHGLHRRFAAVGIEFQCTERGRETGREQGVDEIIQSKMLRLLHRDPANDVIVLATGDGNGYEDDRGFVSTLKLLRSHGYQIEVLAWEHSLSQKLKEWALDHGHVHLLDQLFAELTFVEGRRFAKPLGNYFKKLRPAT